MTSERIPHILPMASASEAEGSGFKSRVGRQFFQWVMTRFALGRFACRYRFATICAAELGMASVRTRIRIDISGIVGSDPDAGKNGGGANQSGTRGETGEAWTRYSRPPPAPGTKACARRRGPTP